MRLETSFFEEPLRILHDETVDDVISEYMDLTHDESAMIFNIGDMVQKIKCWRMKMPRVKPFYAVKCNPNPTVLKVLAALGTGFDCASKAEMRMIRELGVSPSRIIFANPIKPKSHIKEAATLGVQTMTFDNEGELYKVKNLFPTARLVLRIRHDAEDSGTNLGMKFGANPEEIGSLLLTTKFLGLDFAGVSFHVGSGCRDAKIYYEAIQKAREVFDLAIDLGYSPDILDIGGGFPGETGTSIDKFAKHINNALLKFFPDDNVQVIAEPGRYVVASAFSLLTAITAKREVEQEGQKKKIMYYMNDGVYGSFNGIMFDHQTPKPIVIGSAVKEKKNIPLFESQIWGPTCDSVDEVLRVEYLPELNVGQWLMWKNMGAYTIPAITAFNGFPGPNIHLVVPYHTWLSLEDMLNERGETVFEEDAPFELRGNQGDYSKIPNAHNHFEKDQDSHLIEMVKTVANITTLRVIEI